MSLPVILAARRTPIGRFLGGLTRVPSPKLGAFAIQAVLEEGRFFAPGATGVPATPLEVASDASTNVSGLVEDGLGGFWLWAVAGDTTNRAATHAVRIAEMVCDL